MRYESGSLAECGQALNISYPPFPYTYSPANAADSNKSVNEQYESSGSYPSIVRSNDLVVTIAIADYRCTSTQSIANKRRNSATKAGPSQAGKRLVCSIPAMRFVRTQCQKRKL